MWKIIFLVFLGTTVSTVKGVQELGDDCEYDEDCEYIDNATCGAVSLCECKVGYVAHSDKSECLPLAVKMGDECEVPEQCASIPNTTCNNNSCVRIQATNQSVLAKPTEECKTDSDCSMLLGKRFCKNGTCIVELPSLSPKSILSTVTPDIFVLGKPCDNDTDCIGEGSICTEKQCKCKEEFVLAQNLKSCLPKAKSVGDKCSETVQCLFLNGSICENEKCTQKIQKMLTDFGENLPTLKRIIGSSCHDDKECQHMTNALCLENVCQCRDNYVTSPSSNSCLEKAKKEGDPCEIDKQCEAIKEATCIQKKCVKPGIVGTKLRNTNGGSIIGISQLLAAILFAKLFFV